MKRGLDRKRTRHPRSYEHIRTHRMHVRYKRTPLKVPAGRHVYSSTVRKKTKPQRGDTRDILYRKTYRHKISLRRCTIYCACFRSTYQAYVALGLRRGCGERVFYKHATPLGLRFLFFQSRISQRTRRTRKEERIDGLNGFCAAQANLFGMTAPSESPRGTTCL